ncbi:MAG: hypothetical protein ACR2HG_09880 [Pyrinomonadaceae bacterium]
MLTVWRRLHIEVDSMGAAQGNFVVGNFIESARIGAFDMEVLVSNSDLEINRFENGRLVSGSRSFRIVSNSDNSVTIRVLNGGAARINEGEIFTLYDDDDFNDSGTLDGDTGEDIPGPDEVNATTLLQPNDVLCSETITTNCNVFASSYIRPMQYTASDISDNSIFQSNIESNDYSPYPVRYTFGVDFDQVATEADPEFWTIYLYGSYQQNLNADADPDDQNGDGIPHGCGDASYGVVDDLGPDGWGAAIHMEVGRPREYPSNYLGHPVSRAWTAAHEVGHLFGGIHDDGGIMTPSCERTGYEFNPATIRRLRNVITHP